MLLRPLLLALVFSSACLAPATLRAAETPAAVQSGDVYEQFYEVISANADDERLLDNIVGSTKRTLLADPEIAAIEAKYPGYVDAFGVAMKPWMRAEAVEVEKRFHPQAVAILRQDLTIEEARIMVDFYRSPLGMRLIGTMVKNLDFSNTLEGYQSEDAKIDPSDLHRDVHGAAEKTAGELEGGDLTDTTGLIGNRVLLAKLRKVSDRIIALRASMEDAPMDKEFEQQMRDDLTSKAAEFIKNYGKGS